LFFCFLNQIYDRDNDGSLSREEISSMIEMLVGSQPKAVVLTPQAAKLRQLLDDEGPDGIAKRLFESIDADGDGAVTLDEFSAGCEKNPILMALFMEAASSLHEDPALTRTLEQLGLSTFGGQVAGHGSESADAPLNLAMLQSNDGRIWKAYDEIEFKFYEALSTGAIPKGEFVHRIVPGYYGRAFLEYNAVKHNYIIMQNLLSPMKKPCVCDLKIGTRGHGDNADLRKLVQQQLLVSVTTSGTLGFRVCGMRVVQDDQVVKKGKPWGARLMGRVDMTNALNLFLGRDAMSGVRFDVLPGFLNQLHELLAWFRAQTHYRFYSSSILLIYDADTSPADGDAANDGADSAAASSSSGTGAAGGPRLDVKMVDFAHAHPTTDGSLDHSYLTGLVELIYLLEAILAHGPPELQAQLSYRPDVVPREAATKVVVNILSGSDLAPKDLNNKSDPHVIIELDGKKVFRTNVQKATLNPIWNQTFEIPISADAKELLFRVYDKDLIGKDDPMGAVKLGIVEDDEFPFHGSLTLVADPRVAKSHVVSGSIKLSAWFAAD
jgi:Inositol polyphosphate kinase/C2 domain/EF-hand domain pair